jgi:hypothetical protein
MIDPEPQKGSHSRSVSELLITFTNAEATFSGSGVYPIIFLNPYL